MMKSITAIAILAAALLAGAPAAADTWVTVKVFNYSSKPLEVTTRDLFNGTSQALDRSATVDAAPNRQGQSYRSWTYKIATNRGVDTEIAMIFLSPSKYASQPPSRERKQIYGYRVDVVSRALRSDDARGIDRPGSMCGGCIEVSTNMSGNDIELVVDPRRNTW